MDACGENLCTGSPRLAPPAGYFVSPAQSGIHRQIATLASLPRDDGMIVPSSWVGARHAVPALVANQAGNHRGYPYPENSSYYYLAS